MLYGIGYQGSKNFIAKDIINFLPTGNRLVDLFGGGFAISHCALLSGKYKQVYYNELNPLLVQLISKAINGYYNKKNFSNNWVSREDFNAKKNLDGYIKYIWSFGNNGKDYLYGKDIEPYKQALHYAVIYEDYSFFAKLGLLIMPVSGKPLEKVKKIYHQIKVNSLRQLQSLQRLERLERLEINCGSYLDYEYKDGDVVYCDPPYQDTAGYNNTSFNHNQFYDWVNTRDYPVYFSSYPINDTRFIPVLELDKRQTFSPTNNSRCVVETVYWNGQGITPNKHLKPIQNKLF